MKGLKISFKKDNSPPTNNILDVIPKPKDEKVSELYSSTHRYDFTKKKEDKHTINTIDDLKAQSKSVW